MLDCLSYGPGVARCASDRDLSWSHCVGWTFSHRRRSWIHHSGLDCGGVVAVAAGLASAFPPCTAPICVSAPMICPYDPLASASASLFLNLALTSCHLVVAGRSE